jgi:15-cis-phytoene synthase
MTATTTLEESYAACRKLSREFGTTYYWAAGALSVEQRKHVYALYGFCRHADDLVDIGNASKAARELALREFGDRFFADLSRGWSEHPILSAVVNTAIALDLPTEYFERFLRSMHMDLSVRTYDTFDDLMVYMDGSAAVIGEMMVPVLQPATDVEDAARNLGIAFQLTNFLRDVGEDLDRDRVYIPQETIRMFGADPWSRKTTPAWIDVMQHEIARTRAYYRAAEPGIEALTGRSQRCVRAAHQLYGEILDRIEHNGYDVFHHRARVPGWRKMRVAGSAMRPTGARMRYVIKR